MTKTDNFIRFVTEVKFVVDDMCRNIVEPWDEPDPIEADGPKPATPRERLRALKAHPRSARRRR